MSQLPLSPTFHYQPRRSHVPNTPPFDNGQTVRNVRLDRTGVVLEPLHDPLMPGSWWMRVRPTDGSPDTSWLATLCEVA